MPDEDAATIDCMQTGSVRTLHSSNNSTSRQC